LIGFVFCQMRILAGGLARETPAGSYVLDEGKM
jgi:hypothetical protein